MATLTREMYDYIQEASQNFNETFDEMKVRLERQEIVDAAYLALCTHRAVTGAYFAKSGTPALLTWIIDRAGNFVKFMTANAETVFDAETLQRIRAQNWVNKWSLKS